MPQSENGTSYCQYIHDRQMLHMYLKVEDARSLAIDTAINNQLRPIDNDVITSRLS